MGLLTQFLMRLCFGLAAAMATVSPRQVSSGYFRNHLYVVLGLSSLAALLTRAAASEAFGWALATTVLSYAGSVVWLYEKRTLGVAALVAVAAAALGGALVIADAPVAALTAGATLAIPAGLPEGLRYVQTVTSSLLLGATMAAMLLGHWYLNSPGMKLAPLQRLLVAMAAAAAIHAVVCGVGLWHEASAQTLSTHDWLFLVLRWAFGLVGVVVLIWLAWQTLAVPNTQSATGILYVAVMGVFVGETMSLLLSAERVFPV
jgi:hypothetical protein